MNWKQYFRNVKQSAYNLLLDLFAQEKPMSTADWFLYTASYMEGKVEKLYDDETGVLKDYEDTFYCAPCLTYMTEMVREVNVPMTANTKEYNQALLKAGINYADEDIKRKLAKYLANKNKESANA